MTDDIVTRIRNLGINMWEVDVCVAMDEAADEIERLRQNAFMWKMTAVKLAGKMLPFSLLMDQAEQEEIQIVLQEAMTND